MRISSLKKQSNNEISLSEIKQIMLETLKEIDSFCRENGINYYLTGGTLLGAIRHKGFIPWDDDIDIALKRKDYDRLLKEFSSKSGNVEILDYRNRKKFIWPAAKIINNKTILVENGVNNAAIGVYLDMFPLDYIEGDYEAAKRFVNKVSRWKSLLSIKYMRVSYKRSVLKNIVVIIGKVMYLIPDLLILKKIDSISRTYEKSDKSKYICNLAGAWGIREIVEKSVFESAIDHVFEGREYSIPVGYDTLLKSLYGNYMELPPIEKRCSTHVSKAYWK